MNSTTDHSSALVKALVSQAEENARLELANEVLQWFAAHRTELPANLREDFAQMILRICK
jgi:hypothetical protein